MSEGRFNRAATRLIQNETKAQQEKALSMRLGKTTPSERIKIPQIGEWDLEPKKGTNEEQYQTQIHDRKQKAKTSLRVRLSDVTAPVPARTRSVLQAPMQCHAPKPRQTAVDDRIVFPPGTVTTDLNDIIKSKYRTKHKPIPPLDNNGAVQDPQFLPLDFFDSSTFEEFPLEVLMKDPVAFSRYQDLEGNIVWAKCTVLSYDSESRLFTIEWSSNQRQKRVGRFNLRFAREDPELFEKRLAEAKKLAAEHEVAMKFMLRVSKMPTNHLPDLSDDNIEDITSRISVYTPKTNEIISRLVSEISSDFKLVNNILEFKHELEFNASAPSRDEFLSVIKNHSPISGRLEIIEHNPNFAESLRIISENLLIAHPPFQVAIFDMWRIFEDSTSVRLLLSSFPGLISVGDFLDSQRKNLQSTSQRLKSAIRTTIDKAAAKTSTEKSMCSQMAVLAVRMLHTSLSRIVSDSLSSFVALFEKYETIPDSAPQFSLELIFDENGKIKYEPDLDDFAIQLDSLFSELEQVTNDLPNIDSAAISSVNSVSFDDCAEMAQNSAKKFRGVSQRLFSKMSRFVTDHEFLEPVLGLGSDYSSDFDPAGRKSLDEYTKQISDFKTTLGQIAAMEDSHNLGPFFVSCISFKSKATAKLDSLITSLLHRIRSFIVSDLDSLDSGFSEITAKLTQVPSTPEELAETKKYLEKVYTASRELTGLIESTQNRFYFLEKNHFAPPNEDFERWYRIRQMPIKLQSLVDEAERTLSVERIRMIRELKQAEKQVEDEALALSDKLAVVSTQYNDLEMTAEATDAINELHKAVLALQAVQEANCKHERLFDSDQGQSRSLQRLSEELSPLHILWNLAQDWFSASTAWLDTPFTNIKADAMSQFMAASTRKISRLRKNLAQNPLVDRVLNPLSSQIDAFRQNVPLIVRLKHPGVKTLQWQKISAICGFEVSPQTDMTLQQFLDLRLERWGDKIAEIANVAAQEYALESALDDLDSQIQSREILTAKFRDTGQFVLAEVEDLVAFVDELLVTTQTVLASPFIGPNKSRAVEKLAFLRSAHDTLNLWLKCQRDWLYLQPIFTGTSIQQKLRSEAAMWSQVERIWGDVMKATHSHPAFAAVLGRDGLNDDLEKCLSNLEAITAGLNAYLEAKRLSFPRFFFLSNDELIAILSHTGDCRRVQDFMQKLFEYVATVAFEGRSVSAMCDSSGEKVPLPAPVSIDVPEVEDWLISFEEQMQEALKESICDAVQRLKEPVSSWLGVLPAQVVLITNQIGWTNSVETALSENKLRAVKMLLQNYLERLDELTKLVRTPISSQARSALSCLLIFEVHNRDIIQSFVNNDVNDVESFKWVQQLRYYWEDDTVMIRSINNTFEYSYEYAGNSARLVITPLTDRCYQTLLTAFTMTLGGAPSGPAGTGKTETVRDCAKALGRPCVVYNCSEEVTPEQMSQFFAGLASSGSWSCFDEFNRINIEVLSVIAQQVRTIQDAIANKAEKFQLDGRNLSINPNAAVCITMNPGYAGRTELPDNLKALFRPVAMMVPDFVFISEILLFAGGFANATSLAVKLVALFDLCKKQLSNAHHYDWGLRAMKAILSTASKAKRNSTDSDSGSEDEMLVRIVRDCTAPRLLSSDLTLFNGILHDVFPSVNYQPSVDPVFVDNIKQSLVEMNCQPMQNVINKSVDLYETSIVRHGIMLIGGALGGKSTSWKALSASMTRLSSTDKKYKPVSTKSLNPKSITISELFGAFNPITSEWADGVLSQCIRDASFSDDTTTIKWIVVDGPVDSLWIESMNSLLDDNKVLCLPNNERIQLGSDVNLIFEVDDLSQASPATVSRCGMVYFDPETLPWEALADSWKDKIPHKELAQSIRNMMDIYLPPSLQFITADTTPVFQIYPNFAVTNLLRLLSCYIDVMREEEVITDGEEVIRKDPLLHDHFFSPFSNGNENTVPFYAGEQAQIVFERIFIFCLIWSFGGILPAESRQLFDRFIRNELEKNESRCPFPPDGSVFDYYCDLSKFQWSKWIDSSTTTSTTSLPISQQLVPTLNCSVSIFLSRILSCRGFNVLLHGGDTSKTLSIRTLFNSYLNRQLYDCQMIPITSCALPSDISRHMSSYMHKRQGQLGPLPNQRLIFLVDDIGSAKPEIFGAQPPLELLRQFADYGGWYNTATVEFQQVIDTSLIATLSPKPLPLRLLRHFFPIHLPPYSDNEITQIVETLLQNNFTSYSSPCKDRISPISDATATILSLCKQKLLPVPSKLHYIFNLSIISRVISGMLLVPPSLIPSDQQFLRLWSHEMIREFHDRLNTDSDRRWFNNLLNNAASKIGLDSKSSLFSAIGGTYKEMNDDRAAVLSQCSSLLEEHNAESPKQLDIVMFDEAVDHLCFLSRCFSTQRGHAMLLGVKGSGRRSLTRLALSSCSAESVEVFEISITKTYSLNEWREDVKKLLKRCGVDNEKTALLIGDAQILFHEQLADISALMAGDQIPLLFEADEAEQIRGAILQEQDDDDDHRPPWDKFIARILANLHIVLVLSPFASAFKDVTLFFPKIRNEAMIDWFMPWSESALTSVAKATLKDSTVVDLVVRIHRSAEETASKFSRETKRATAVTPSRYFELLQTFSQRHTSSQRENNDQIKDYTAGIDKIKSTQAQIAEMKAQLDRDIPILQKTSAEVNEVLAELSVKSAECAETQKEVKAQSDVAEKEAAEATEANRIAQGEFERVTPLLEEAQNAVSKLDKDSLTYIKKLLHPSAGMKDTFDAVCIMFNRSPHKVDGPTPGTKEDDYWPETLSLLNDVRFSQNIQSFRPEQMKPETVAKLRKYVPTDPAQREEKKKAAQQSFAAVGAFYDWVCASFDYYGVYQEILPLKIKAEEAQAKLERSQALLQASKEHLAAVEQTLQSLQDKVDAMRQKEAELKADVERNELRLDRANKIMKGLSGEAERWKVVSEGLKSSAQFLLGDSVLTAAVLTYFGAFSPHFRVSLLTDWFRFLNESSIQYSAGFSVSGLGNDAAIRDWVAKGLPNDNHSVENAIIIDNSPNAFPLLIDPQLSGTKWLRAVFGEKLIVLRSDQNDFLRQLKGSITSGLSVLIENAGLELDPILDPILSHEVVTIDGSKTITIGGDQISYSDSFRLYISTQYPNPQYSPEVCAQVQLINFATTPEGLTDLLLNNLLEVERSDLDEKRLQLVEAAAQNAKKMREIESEILRIVSNAGSDILDDQSAINTLQNAQETSAEIARQMAASETTEAEISAFKQKFSSVAQRAALLYFCVSDFAVVDPMYQFSLNWFVSLFRTALTNADHNSSDLINSFNSAIALRFYESVSHSLFSRHKLLFSTLMTVRILVDEFRISAAELSFLLSPASAITESVSSLKSPNNFISDEIWRAILSLEGISEVWTGLSDSFTSSEEQWKEYIASTSPETFEIPHKGLSSFQKLIILRLLRLERVREGLHLFIEETLGPAFVRPPTLNLQKVFKESSPLSPLIFIIMPGIDPQSEIVGVATALELDKYVKSYSLGRGRGKGAEELLQEAKEKGFVVLLQNCHLSLSWMPTLEQFLSSLDPETVHPRFRLCLDTMSTPQFPIGILYAGTKLIYEIPKGMRENVLRIYSGFNQDEYDSTEISYIEKQLTFRLSFFHSIVLERLQFGSLGWNIPYEFNPSDFSISRKHLRVFLNEMNDNQIPFEALSYVIGELNYGGRVTDHWDRRLLISLLGRFFSDKELDQNRYISPNSDLPLTEVITLLESWPGITQGEDVGLSSNASTISARNEAMSLFGSLMEVQSTFVSSSESISEEKYALNLVEEYRKILPSPFNIFTLKKKFSEGDTIGTVIHHEVQLYNNLINTISNSLNTMEKGLKGLILVDSELETLKRRLMSNKVPEQWLSKSFPSILTLRRYLSDLKQRVEFIDNWIRMGQPPIIKLGAFFHPEEFLTAVLQVYARKYNTPFDSLIWKTIPISHPITSPPNEGVYIEGLPIEGAKWDNENKCLIECGAMETINKLPVFHLEPSTSKDNDPQLYECPVFRTQNRGTGAMDLPNYILSLYLSSGSENSSHWVERSVAAFITVQ